jgi:hypothetical protein
MSLQRKYSKAKANGNRVVWTSQEPMSVPYSLDGMLYNNAEWGIFTVTGRDLYCLGFRVDFRVPGGDPVLQCNILAAGARLYLNGVTMGGEKAITPSLRMPVGSSWKFRMELESPDGSDLSFPQGVTATYRLCYAQGALPPLPASGDPLAQGIGFERIGSTFVVE